MRMWKLTLMSGLALLLLVTVACSVSTTPTSITGLKLGKDKDAAAQTSTFATGDTIYGVADVSSPGKVKVTGRLVIDDVEGQAKGPIPGLETSVDLTSTGSANFNFTSPTAGWPKGKYTLEVVMLDEAGAQKDKKSVPFTVS